MFFFYYYFNRTRYHVILITALYEWTLDVLRTTDEHKPIKPCTWIVFSLQFRVHDIQKMKAIKIVFRLLCFTSWSSLCFNVKSDTKIIIIITLMHYVYYYSQLLLPIITIIIVILLHDEFLQFDWLRTVVFQLNLKYLPVKITNLLWVALIIGSTNNSMISMWYLA